MTNQRIPSMISTAVANSSRVLQAAIKQNQADQMTWAKEQDVGIVHIFDENDPMGGMTIAFRKSTAFNSGVMVDCAVATCSLLDRFNRKTGTSLAIQAFKRGEFIQLPILRVFTKPDLAWAVKRAFTQLSAAI
jgi:hypothetical protein